MMVVDVRGYAEQDGPVVTTDGETEQVHQEQVMIVEDTIVAPADHQHQALVVADDRHQFIGHNCIIEINAEDHQGEVEEVVRQTIQEEDEELHENIELMEQDQQHQQQEEEDADPGEEDDEDYEEEEEEDDEEEDEKPLKQLPHESSSGVTYVCDICLTGFDTEEKAIEHQNSHGDSIDEFVTGLKRRRTKSGAPRRRRKPNTTTSSLGGNTAGLEIRHDCPKCGRSFALEKSLQRHINSDCGRAPAEHLCGVCNKSYASTATLKMHMSCHSKDLSYQCSTCAKKFRTQIQLNVHSRVHTGEKPYKCDQCERAFAHRETLLTHKSMHSGYKRFLCIFCGDRFSCISNLKSHRKARKDSCALHPIHTRPVGENEDITMLMIGTSVALG